MSKQSDLALEGAIQESWTTLRNAHFVRRLVSRAALGMGLAGVVLTPLLNLPEQSDAPADRGDVYNTTVHPPQAPGPSHEHERIPYLIPYPVYRKRPGPDGPRPLDEPTKHIKVATELNIRSAAASKLWHRSSFEKVGNEFWALPDASFKLVLLDSAFGGSGACNTARCEADFRGSFVNARGNASQATIEVRGQRIITRERVTGCRPVVDNVPYLACELRPASAVANERTCLYLRRAPKGETGEELVALEIRWEKRVPTGPTENVCDL